MRCPICGTGMKRVWIKTDPKWWSGLYECNRGCGQLKMSGTWRNFGLGKKIEHWHPSCPQCGHDHVCLTSEGYQNFTCLACGRRFEVRDKKLGRTWQPAPGAAILEQTA